MKYCATTESEGCGSGEYCFYEPPCNDNQSDGGSYFCGDNPTFANYCTQACPSGLNGECPYGQQCYNVDTCQELTMSPTSSPTRIPRQSRVISYTFCLSHGILTPTYKLVRKTSESVDKLMMKKFVDEVQDIDPKWELDETKFEVSNVDTIWTDTVPQGFQCVCDGETSSTCSAVVTTATVDVFEELDTDTVRYGLLHFQPYVTENLKYKADYFGYVPFEETVDFKMDGVPSPEMSKETQDTFHGIVKEFLREDIAKKSSN
jgi:hypothetical protein